MKMVKILQLAVVAMFVLMVGVGVLVLFTAQEHMGSYIQLIEALFPVFLAQVIPALIGSPLTDIMRAKAGAITASAQAPEKAPE